MGTPINHKMKCIHADHPGTTARSTTLLRAPLKLIHWCLPISHLRKLPRPPGRGPIPKVAQAASLCLLNTKNRQAACSTLNHRNPKVAQAASLCPHHSLRHQHRNDPAAAAAIDAKVLVEREDTVAVTSLHHCHQTGIGQRHGQIAVFLHEREGPIPMISQREIHLEKSPLKPKDDLLPAFRAVLKQKPCFRQHRLAGDQRRMHLLQRISHPSGPKISPIKSRHQDACIDDKSLPHRPKPSMCFGFVDRSPKPLSKQPRSSFTKSYIDASSSTAAPVRNSRSSDSRIKADLETPSRFAFFSRRTANSSGNFTVIVFIPGKVIPSAAMRNTGIAGETMQAACPTLNPRNPKVAQAASLCFSNKEAASLSPPTGEVAA